MGVARYEDASDGFLARVAPTWTEEKLAILACYLNGFAVACKRHPRGWYALDIFAGGGLNVSETTGAEIAGSALIALESGPPPARVVVVCERDRKARRGACASRPSAFGSRVRVFDGGRQRGDSGHARADAARCAERSRSSTRRGRSWTGRPLRRLPSTSPAPYKKVEQLILLPDRYGLRAHPPVDQGSERDRRPRRSPRCTGTTAGARSTSAGERASVTADDGPHGVRAALRAGPPRPRLPARAGASDHEGGLGRPAGLAYVLPDPRHRPRRRRADHGPLLRQEAHPTRRAARPGRAVPRPGGAPPAPACQTPRRS